MSSNLSASVLRPSVIKWVGKYFTIDLDFNGRKKDDFDDSKVGRVRQYTRTAQEQKQANFSNESSATCHLDDIINKSSFPNSKIKKPQRKYVCMICKRTFKWRSHWKSHERIHTGERPFKCKICGKAFTRSDGLQCHKKVHMNITKSYSTKAEENPVFINKDVQQDLAVSKQEKVFLCAHCGRTFGSFAGYCRHADRHKDTDDLKCHICNISFNRPSALRIHNRVHTGIKPYQCNICSKAFSVRGNLKRHLFVHSGEKPYNCTYCSSCFNNSSHLQRHIRSKHKKFVVA